MVFFSGLIHLVVMATADPLMAAKMKQLQPKAVSFPELLPIFLVLG